MTRAVAALGLGALVMVVASAHAETPGTKPKPDPVVAFEVDVGALPTGDIPTMLVEADRPKPMPEGFVKGQGIAIVKTGTSFELIPEATVPASVQTRAASAPLPKTGVGCDSKETKPPWPLRWESIALGAGGDAELRFQDGWMDPRACKITAQRDVTMTAKAVAFLDGAPIVFAMREPDAITFLVPPADTAAGDATSGAIKWQRGMVSRVRLPIARGGSSAIAFSLDAGRAATWVAQMAGKKAVDVTPGPMTIRIEASQAVGEDKPTVLVRIVSRDRLR